MPDKIAVGIDLGFRHSGMVAAAPTHTQLGYEVLGFDCVVTKKESKKKSLYVAEDDVSQSMLLYRGIRAFLQKWDPTFIAVELPSAGAKGARANRGMGIATGIIAAIAEETGLPSVWVVPTDSKVAMCGTKTASKEDMQDKARELWPQVQWSTAADQFEHIADAAAALLVARGSAVYKLLRGSVE